MRYSISGRIKVKIFTFVKDCGIIVVENKKTENYNAIKNFESAFQFSTI